jgi:hypothetical protein
MSQYSNLNAEPVLAELEKLIARGCPMPMHYVCDKLSIFDWWPDRLTITHMKQMRSFLKQAIKLGYTGYVCFKVGASGCSNGMWAHKEESTDGYSPKGDCIYRSFTPDYTYWQFNEGGEWFPEGDKFDSLKTGSMLKAAIEAHRGDPTPAESGQ